MPELEIVKAEMEDVPVVLSFIRKLAEYEKLSHEVTADENALRQYLFGERPAAEVLLAVLRGRAVGFALFFTTFSTFLARPGIYLEDLYIDVDQRGKGIGKALLRHLARLTEERGYGRLEWAVLDWNAPSIAFYKSLGAKPLEEWTTYRLTGEALRDCALS